LSAAGRGNLDTFGLPVWLLEREEGESKPQASLSGGNRATEERCSDYSGSSSVVEVVVIVVVVVVVVVVLVVLVVVVVAVVVVVVVVVVGAVVAGNNGTNILWLCVCPMFTIRGRE